MRVYVLAERWEATQQGVASARAKINSYEEAQARAAENPKPSDTSARLLSKFFRRATPHTVKIGHARVFIEEAVMHTERQLFEKKRTQVASTASKEERAEILAAELYHKPGSLLSEREYAHIYTSSQCEELREEVDCDMVQFVNVVRTADGTCNNLEHPTQGASETPFARILPPRYEDGLFMPNGLRQSQFRDNRFRNGSFTPPYPSARLVSSTIIRDRQEEDDVNTHLLMQIGQFIDHDLDLTVEFPSAEVDTACENFRDCEINSMCAPIQVPEDDDNFGVDTPRGGNCLPFARTVPACPNIAFAFVPREQVNELTHYIDGSQIYGSDELVALALREMSDGLLKTSPALPDESQTQDNLPTSSFECPRDQSTCFIAGDIRVNEQVSLTVMHTVWVREHNRVARQLKTLNPSFDDERLYQDARRIVVAEWQQVIYEEYLPIILGPNHGLPPYVEYQPDVDASVPNSFATAAYRFGHSQIQPQFERLDESGQSISRGPLNLVDAFMNPQEFIDGGGVNPIARGWISQPGRRLDEFLNSVLTTQLFEIEPGMGMDLATLNVQRGRDHGLAPYLVWKNYCEDRFGLSSDFANELTKIRILQTYGSLETVDLFVGALAEEPLPGAVVGATLGCIFNLTFTRLRAGDRFWYQNTELNVFTDAQLAEIERTSMARILCDNTDIQLIQANPFQQGTAGICGGGTFSFGVPGIRFDPAFRDDEFCYFSVALTPPGRPNLNINVINVQQGDEVFELFPLTNVQPERNCVPYRCPTSAVNTVIAAFPANTDGSNTNFIECDVAVINAPANDIPGASVSFYQATFTTADVAASGNGLYNSMVECLNDNTVGISYTCSASSAQASPTTKTASTAELEHELARILSGSPDDKPKKATKQSSASPILEKITMDQCLANPTIPDEVCNSLKDSVVS